MICCTRLCQSTDVMQAADLLYTYSLQLTFSNGIKTNTVTQVRAPHYDLGNMGGTMARVL